MKGATVRVYEALYYIVSFSLIPKMAVCLEHYIELAMFVLLCPLVLYCEL